jgi:hypothetical protein
MSATAARRSDAALRIQDVEIPDSADQANPPPPGCMPGWPGRRGSVGP